MYPPQQRRTNVRLTTDVGSDMRLMRGSDMVQKGALE